MRLRPRLPGRACKQLQMSRQADASAMDQRAKVKGPLQANQHQNCAKVRHQLSAPGFESALSLLSACPTASVAQNEHAEKRSSSGTATTDIVRDNNCTLIYRYNLSVCGSSEASIQQCYTGLHPDQQHEVAFCSSICIRNPWKQCLRGGSGISWLRKPARLRFFELQPAYTSAPATWQGKPGHTPFQQCSSRAVCSGPGLFA